MSGGKTSIAQRLAWRLGGLFLVALLGAGLLPFVLDHDERSELAANVMQSRLERLAAALRFDPDGSLSVALPADIDFAYRIYRPDGSLLAEQGDPPPAHVRKSIEIETGSTHVASPIGPLVLEVIPQNLSPDAWMAFVWEWLTEPFPFLMLLLVGVLLIGIRTIAASLAPLKRLTADAARISPQHTDVRLSADRLSSELVPMVRSINAALDRLDEGFRHQREFTADAAHELRTPLAVLSAHIDTLPDRATAAALRQDVERMSRLVDQLLAVAELAALPLEPPVSVDLGALTRELASSMVPYALKAGRELAVLGSTEAVPVRGHPEAIRRALRNLVENAVQYAPRASAVEIEVTAEPAIHVLDRGPGIPASIRSHVRERFWRKDRSQASGAGLGLAIVERIAAAENARLVIEDRHGGGADIALVFAPAAG